MAAQAVDDRVAQVWDRLRTVTDPELDESVVDLNFITEATVGADGRVQIGFRLPTYWCAANFSYLMADDMRAAVAALSWVSGVDLRIDEHMYADKINAGLARSASFEEAFGDEAEGDLAGLRRTFLLKAFQRRQSALLDRLVAAGHGAAALADMTVEELRRLRLDAETDALRARYLERREVAAAPGVSRAFVDVEGDRLQAETLPVYMRALRRVSINAEFNGALCRGLLKERYGLDVLDADSAEMTHRRFATAQG
jgi:metal-sulfur cluster biosynthetic enzyme